MFGFARGRDPTTFFSDCEPYLAFALRSCPRSATSSLSPTTMPPARVANSISASRQQPLGNAQVAVDDGRLLPSDSPVLSALPFLPHSNPQGTPANQTVVPGWALHGIILPPCSTSAAKFQNGDLIRPPRDHGRRLVQLLVALSARWIGVCPGCRQLPR